MGLLEPLFRWLPDSWKARALAKQQRTEQDDITSAIADHVLPGAFPPQDWFHGRAMTDSSHYRLQPHELRAIRSFVEILGLEISQQIVANSQARTLPTQSLRSSLDSGADAERSDTAEEMIRFVDSVQAVIQHLAQDPLGFWSTGATTAKNSQGGAHHSVDDRHIKNAVEFLDFLAEYEPTQHRHGLLRCRGQLLPRADISKLGQFLEHHYPAATGEQKASASETRSGTALSQPTAAETMSVTKEDRYSITEPHLAKPEAQSRSIHQKKRRLKYLTTPRKYFQDSKRSLRSRPDTAHAQSGTSTVVHVWDDPADGVTVNRLIDAFAMRLSEIHKTKQDDGNSGLLTPDASDEEDGGVESSMRDGADSGIGGLSRPILTAFKRKSTHASDKRTAKRLRLVKRWSAPSFQHDTRRDESDGAVITPRPVPSRAADPLALPKEDTDSPQLRISFFKQEGIRLQVQERLEKEENARREKLERESEERRLKEAAERLKSEEERRLRDALRQPTRPVIASINQDWTDKIRKALNAHQNVDLAKSPEGTMLRSKDFQTVVPAKNWLNDEVVNGSVIHLANYINERAGTKRCHAFTSFFWPQLKAKGATGTIRWMKRAGVTKDNFLDFDTILIPICSGLHWTLVVVQPQKRKIAHMDSMGDHGAGKKTVTDTVHQWVRDFLQDGYTSDWQVVDFRSPPQINGNDCGVHTITNAIFLTLGLDPSFYRAEEMPLQRRRLAAMLLNGGFNGDFNLEGF